MRRFQFKHMLAGTLLAAAATVTPVAADGWGDCCGWNDCCWDGEFYGTVEALYWKPSICPVEVATERPTTPAAAVLDLSFNQNHLAPSLDYQWGVRGRIGYENDCSFVDLAYLYIRPSDTTTFGRGEGRLLILPLNLASQVDAVITQTSLRYQNVDFRYGHFINKECGSNFFIYGNARWVDLEFNSNARGRNVLAAVIASHRDVYDQTASFDGGGLGLGVGGHYCIGCGFGVGGSFGAMAVIGNTKLDQTLGNQTDILAQTPLLRFGLTRNRFGSRTVVSPALDLRIGFDYSLCWDCFSLTGEIGYELNYYWDVLRYTSAAAEGNNLVAPVALIAPQSAAAECQNVGFGGLYFGLTFAF